MWAQAQLASSVPLKTKARNPHAIASNKPRDAAQPQSIRINN